MLLNSLYDAITTLPRAEIKLGWVYPDSDSPELLKVYISCNIELFRKYHLMLQ